MRRGTTPTFLFILPADSACFSDIEIVFVQNGMLILTLNRADLTLDGNEVSFVMTEEQSMAFSPSLNGEIQIRLVAQDGTVLISEIRTFPVRKKYPEDIQ
jgi:hypothetical protein